MKHFFAAFCLLCLLFSLSSCASGIVPVIETSKTEETAKTVETDAAPSYPAIPERLTWEKIEAIPVANDEMTTDQLRQICLDYFRLQLTFLWTPSESFSYEIKSQNKFPELLQGEIYAGLPYNGGAGNLYKIMKYYDPETGVVNVVGRGEDFAAAISNHCSYGSFWGWARVANSMDFGLTHSITAARGAIPVGPYRYDTTIESFKNHPTREICETNGEQVMYQSYAALLPADGVVHYNDGGHVQMVVENHPVYNADGTLDGKKSYAIILDQGSAWKEKTDRGISYALQGGVDQKVSYETFFRAGYLPFTLAEFVGLSPVEAPDTALNLSGAAVSPKELREAKITSNYTISDVTVSVTSPDGKTLYTYTGLGNSIHCYEYAMSACVFPASLNSYADGSNRVKVECRIGTGALFTLWEGVLK